MHLCTLSRLRYRFTPTSRKNPEIFWHQSRKIKKSLVILKKNFFFTLSKSWYRIINPRYFGWITPWLARICCIFTQLTYYFLFNLNIIIKILNKIFLIDEIGYFQWWKIVWNFVSAQPTQNCSSRTVFKK